jgi:hypothetical protein
MPGASPTHSRPRGRSEPATATKPPTRSEPASPTSLLRAAQLLPAPAGANEPARRSLVPRLQRLIGNQAVQRLLDRLPAPTTRPTTALIQRSALSDQLKHTIAQQPKAAVLTHIGTHRATINADPDSVTLIGTTYTGDDLWMAQTSLAHGVENTWPFHLKVERTKRAGGGGTPGVFTLLRTDNGANAANALLTNSLQQILGSVPDDLWVAQQLQLHGTEMQWPLHVKLERQMRTGGGGKEAVFTLLRGANGAQAADVNLTAAIARVFPVNSDELWIAQQLQAHGKETQWPLHLRIERETRSGGRGKDEIFKMLRVANGAAAADALVTAAVNAAFTAGSDDLWLAQQLQTHGQEAGWPNDLKVLRMLKGFAAIDQPTILQLLLAATAPQFDNAQQYMSEHHNTIVLQMLYAANDTDFGNFMGKMTGDQTRTFLENVSTWNKVYYTNFVARIKTTRLVKTGEANVGNFEWRGGSSPDPGAGHQVSTTTAWGRQNDFARWIRGLGPIPTNNSTMNCWQGVLFIAHRAGLINLSWLQTMDTEAAAAAEATSGSAQSKVKAYYNVLEKHLYSGSRKTLTFDGTGISQPTMPAGQIVFINGLDHVLMSKGTRDGTNRQQVLSLWIKPAYLPLGPLTMFSHGVLQDTTLEQVHPVTDRQATDRLEYAAPPW